MYRIKNKLATAKKAVDINKQIQECPLCKSNLELIEKHHPDVKNIVTAVYDIAKCRECKNHLQSIITCTKLNHGLKIELEKPQYKCSICGMEYLKSEDCALHELMHNKNDEKYGVQPLDKSI